MRKKLGFQVDRIEATVVSQRQASNLILRMGMPVVGMIYRRGVRSLAREGKSGRELERKVADFYRRMGAWKVEHDVLKAGHQIDVYVEMVGLDHSLHRVAVEAKNWQCPVGIDVVRDWALVVDSLRRAGLIDEGVIVSHVGFTKPARQAAADYSRRGLPIRLLELADLQAYKGK